MNPGREMYCCQKTIQYLVKIKRKSMNFGFESTVRKLRPTCAIEGGGASLALRGSRKKNNTSKNLFNAEVRVRLVSYIGSGRAADVDQGVVNRVAQGAHIFLRRARGGSHDARFHQ